MKKHLTSFDTNNQYDVFKKTNNYRVPGVSLIKDTDTVIYNSSCRTIDLGLPSGTLWADRNLRATNPTNYGLYYSWGDIAIAGKEITYHGFFDDDYDTEGRYTEYDELHRTILELPDDAAYFELKGNWRMPSLALFDELIANTNVKNIYNTYMVLESKINGNEIIFPFNGNGFDGDAYDLGQIGWYWTNLCITGNDDLYAYAYSFNPNSNDKITRLDSSRSAGLGVRPVLLNS